MLFKLVIVYFWHSPVSMKQLNMHLKLPPRYFWKKIVPMISDAERGIFPDYQVYPSCLTSLKKNWVPSYLKKTTELIPGSICIPSLNRLIRQAVGPELGANFQHITSEVELRSVHTKKVPEKIRSFSLEQSQATFLRIWMGLMWELLYFAVIQIYTCSDVCICAQVF